MFCESENGGLGGGGRGENGDVCWERVLYSQKLVQENHPCVFIAGQAGGREGGGGAYMPCMVFEGAGYVWGHTLGGLTKKIVRKWT